MVSVVLALLPRSSSLTLLGPSAGATSVRRAATSRALPRTVAYWYVRAKCLQLEKSPDHLFSSYAEPWPRGRRSRLQHAVGRCAALVREHLARLCTTLRMLQIDCHFQFVECTLSTWLQCPRANQFVISASAAKLGFVSRISVATSYKTQSSHATLTCCLLCFTAL